MILDQHQHKRDLPPALKLFLLCAAVAIWLPCLHLFYQAESGVYRSSSGVAPKASMMFARHLQLWTDPQLRAAELAKMQQRNPEWDFMSRTYFVLALANIALRDGAYKRQAVEIIDLIIDNTLKIEQEKGAEYFLLGYGRSDAWVMQPARSQFIDGEIALMLAARRFVAEKEEYKPLLAERVRIMLARMRQSPVLCAESYPDECWIFCNTVSLAAIRMADALDGTTEHAAFLAEWIATAKRKLLEPESGLLISAFGVDGKPSPSGFGPEGTSIWMASHMLQIVDKAFADDQYRRAKKELAASFLGFGYSREWPTSSPGVEDVDSGPIVPLLGASTGASGLAFIAAAGFDDQQFFSSLLTSLNLAGFPKEKDGMLWYQASNPVGDAVLLYSMVEGPLWREVQRRGGQ